MMPLVDGYEVLPPPALVVHATRHIPIIMLTARARRRAPRRASKAAPTTTSASRGAARAGAARPERARLEPPAALRQPAHRAARQPSRSTTSSSGACRAATPFAHAPDRHRLLQVVQRLLRLRAAATRRSRRSPRILVEASQSQRRRRTSSGTSAATTSWCCTECERRRRWARTIIAGFSRGGAEPLRRRGSRARLRSRSATGATSIERFPLMSLTIAMVQHRPHAGLAPGRS